MKKLTVLLMVLLVVMTAIPGATAADEPAGYVTISIDGEGTWDGGNLSAFMFPGEIKCFEVTVYNNANVSMQVSLYASPGCDDASVSACCYPTKATLAVDNNVTLVLIITASGVAPPGEYSINMTVETTAEPVIPVIPDPAIGVPHYITISSLFSNRTAGEQHELTATVYDVYDDPVPGVLVQWTVPTGNASISSADTVTSASGHAGAVIRSAAAGVSTVRLQVIGSTAVFSLISLTWVVVPDDGEEPVETAGLPAWVVFIIGIAIIGVIFGGYIYLKRRQERKKFFSDPLTRPGKMDPIDFDNLDNG